MIIRGTTPTLEFAIPFDTELIDEAFVTLSQNREVVIDKPLQDCECSENKLLVQLTQQETLSLACDCITEIQVRVRLKDGAAMASNIITVDTKRILKDGAI